MKLVGQLDSPYVRRVAISLALMDRPFMHISLSVFRDAEAFAAINPLLKAPSFVTDDGIVLMDSTLILDHIAHTVPPAQRLMPEEIGARTRALHTLGLAMAAADKAVQLVYERVRRPAETQYRPWAERVIGQLRGAFAGLQADYADTNGDWLLGRLTQADISTAVAWRFACSEVGDVFEAADYPAVGALAARAEALAVFRQYPHA